MIWVITGATSGIGAQIASQISTNHLDHVYALSRHPKENTENITYIFCDLTQRISIQDAVAQIMNKEKNIDVLINNAGMGDSGPFEHESEENEKITYETNLLGSITLTRMCIPYLKESKGKILFISSLAGVFPQPFQLSYSYSKAAIINLSRGLKNELRPFHVQVGCLVPGDIHTEFTEHRMRYNEPTDYLNYYPTIDRQEKSERKGMAPSKVAKVAIRECKKRHMASLKTIGFGYSCLLFLNRLLPYRLIDWILYELFGK